jgi:hypothetical protein
MTHSGRLGQRRKPPPSEVPPASEAKNCDLLIEIGGRMDEVCESYHKVF